jgi:hypothetical protein
LSIWDISPVVIVTKYGPNGRTQENLVNWRHSARSIDEKTDKLTVIDPSEKAYFVAFMQIDKSIWAVDYDAFLESRSGEIWKGGAIVSNLPKSS